MRITETGRAYAASVEYLVTLPCGCTHTIWSPPWGEDLTDEQRLAGAEEFAFSLAATHVCGAPKTPERFTPSFLGGPKREPWPNAPFTGPVEEARGE